MTDMKKAEELAMISTVMEHIQRLRETKEEILYMFHDGGPVIWVSSKAQENHVV